MTIERPPRPALSAPLAAVKPSMTTLHGCVFRDDYAWLKAANWQDVLKRPETLGADIRAYLDEENAFTAAVLRDGETLRHRLVAEMRGRIKEDDAAVPEPDGPFAYYTRYRDGGQHSLVCRTPREGGAEQLLLDGDAESAESRLFRSARRRALTRSPPSGLGGRHEGLRALRGARARPRRRPGSCRRSPRHLRRDRLGGGCHGLLLRRRRRASSPRARHAPPPRRQRRQGRR